MPEGERRPLRRAWTPVWRRRWWIALATLFILVWWLLPPLLYRHTGTAKDAKLKAITDTRTALLAGLIGVGALLTFWLNRRVYLITEQGHITDRYTKAIEQLGSDKLDVRLGGIYGLERIANDSKRDHPTVVEVLSAFIREHANQQPSARPWRKVLTKLVRSDGNRPDDLGVGQVRPDEPATDVQAALTVLGRLPKRSEVSRGNLSGAQLVGATLGGANLSDAQLGGANLSGARLFEANLSGARLFEANLSGARLFTANLSDAQLVGANLSGATLGGANLSDAQLVGANLSGAQLVGANLSGAWLFGANLSEALELTQVQLDAAQGDALTQLPAGLERPASWAAGEESAPTNS